MAEGGRDRHECTICLDSFIRPKIIPCYHTFCEGCLDRFIKTNSHFNKFKCPVCRKATSIPQGGAKGFTNNFYLDQDQPLPERGHIDEPEQGISNYCSKHKEEAKIYCSKCEIALCDSCYVIYDHKHHTMLIADMDKHIRDSLILKRKKLEDNIQIIKDSLERSELKLNDLDTSAATACQNVDTQIDKACTQVKRQGRKIKEEINRIQSAGRMKFATHKISLTNVLGELQTGVDRINEVLTCRSFKALMQKIPSMSPLPKDKQNLSTDVPVVRHPYFPLVDINTDSLNQKLGVLQIMDGPTFTASFNLDNIMMKDATVYSNDIEISGVSMCIAVKHCCNRKSGKSTIGIYLYLNSVRYSVDFSLKLLHQTDDEKSITKRTDFQNEYNGYGWSSFITLQELNGFLNNNYRFTIQATVTECEIGNFSQHINNVFKPAMNWLFYKLFV